MARELGAPPGVKPIEWRLLTNRSAATLEAVVESINWYRVRWEIELLFLALKAGCRVEALQLATTERIERALALFLVVAWRVARLGGFLGRKGDSEPGVKTIWLGLRRIMDFAAAIKFAREAHGL